MFQRIILFSFILVIAASCKKDVVTDFTVVDKKIIEDYLTAKNLTAQAQSTASGLYYIIEKPGDANHPTISSSVSAYYKGYLTNDVIFEQTTTETATFPLTNLITGWQEGLQLIGVGGKIKLLIPSALGFGSRPTSNIPANSVLIFDVELVSISK